MHYGILSNGWSLYDFNYKLLLIFSTEKTTYHLHNLLLYGSLLGVIFCHFEPCHIWYHKDIFYNSAKEKKCVLKSKLNLSLFRLVITYTTFYCVVYTIKED